MIISLPTGGGGGGGPGLDVEGCLEGGQGSLTVIVGQEPSGDGGTVEVVSFQCLTSEFGDIVVGKSTIANGRSSPLLRSCCSLAKTMYAPVESSYVGSDCRPAVVTGQPMYGDNSLALGLDVVDTCGGKDGGLSTGAIVGIALGAVALGALIAAGEAPCRRSQHMAERLVGSLFSFVLLLFFILLFSLLWW